MLGSRLHGQGRPTANGRLKMEHVHVGSGLNITCLRFCFASGNSSNGTNPSRTTCKRRRRSTGRVPSIGTPRLMYSEAAF